MIVFDLKCGNSHAFEAWFPGSAAFDQQVKAAKISCPVCGSDDVHKALMAPSVATRKSPAPRHLPDASESNADFASPDMTANTPAVADSGDGPPALATKGDFERAAKMVQMLHTMLTQVEDHCEDVGPSFAEEARKIHYGEVEHHNIYGETTPDEAASLHEEGVDFGVLPWPKAKDA